MFDFANKHINQVVAELATSVENLASHPLEAAADIAQLKNDVAKLISDVEAIKAQINVAPAS